jgi:hypothetical protein
LINKGQRLDKFEKDKIFEFIIHGEDMVRMRKEYITSMIIIFNSFFEYGFIRKSVSSSTGGRSVFTDEWADGDDSN